MPRPDDTSMWTNASAAELPRIKALVRQRIANLALKGEINTREQVDAAKPAAVDLAFRVMADSDAFQVRLLKECGA